MLTVYHFHFFKKRFLSLNISTKPKVDNIVHLLHVKIVVIFFVYSFFGVKKLKSPSKNKKLIDIKLYFMKTFAEKEKFIVCTKNLDKNLKVSVFLHKIINK